MTLFQDKNSRTFRGPTFKFQGLSYDNLPQAKQNVFVETYCFASLKQQNVPIIDEIYHFV